MKIFTDYEKEQRLAIGYACTNRDNAETFLQLMEAKDFPNPVYAEIYDAIGKAFEGFFDVTPLSVSEYLDETIATDHHLTQYVKEFEASEESIYAVARLLRDMRLRHHIKKLSASLEENVYLSSTSGYELIERLEVAVSALQQKAGLTAFKYTTPTEVTDNARKYTDLIKSGKQIGIPTGIKYFEEKLRWGGYALGELTVAGAVRSTGKTALAVQSFYECGMNDIPAVYINLESTNESLYYRMSLRFTDGEIISTHSLNNEAFEKKLNAFHTWFKSKKLFFESRIRDVKDLKVYVKNMVAKYGIKAVFVDYGNKLRNDRMAREQRYRQLTDTYETLQELAIQHNIAVVALHQLTQKAENEDYKPTLADFKESGGVSDVADTCVLIWGSRTAKDIHCRIAKQKNYKISAEMLLRYDREKQVITNGMQAEQLTSAF